MMLFSLGEIRMNGINEASMDATETLHFSKNKIPSEFAKGKRFD